MGRSENNTLTTSYTLFVNLYVAHPLQRYIAKYINIPGGLALLFYYTNSFGSYNTAKIRQKQWWHDDDHVYTMMC